MNYTIVFVKKMFRGIIFRCIMKLDDDELNYLKFKSEINENVIDAFHKFMNAEVENNDFFC